MVDTSWDVLRLRGYYRRESDSLWRVAKIYGDTINLDTTKYAGGEVRFRVFDAEGDSLSYRFRYRFDSVWVDADVEYVDSFKS